MNIDEMKQKVLESKKRLFPVHDCSMCRYKCGYIIYNNIPHYDSGCDCVNYENVQPRSWEDMFEHYNMQSDKGKEIVLSEWFGE